MVIATPGRLADHLRSSNTFSIKKIRFLVMDEADRLLEQGCTDFTVDLEAIWQPCRPAGKRCSSVQH